MSSKVYGLTPIDAEYLGSGSSLFHAIYRTVPQIRINITTLSGGVSPIISAFYFKGIS